MTPVSGEAHVDEVLNKTDDVVARRFELAVGDHVTSPETDVAALERSTSPVSSEFQVFSDDAIYSNEMRINFIYGITVHE